MIVKELKDLKVGDRVTYNDVYIHDKLRVSGEGVIFGFSKVYTIDCVWIASDNGEIQSIAYENIKKL